VVDAVRSAIEVQHGMIERNAGVPTERRIEFRVGIHLADVVEEADGDLMGDGINVAARLEGICAPSAICLSEDAYRQVKGRLDLAVTDLGPVQLKNITEPIRVYSLQVGAPAVAKPAPAPAPEKSAPPRLSMVVLPFVNIGGDPEQENFVDGVTESLTTDRTAASPPSLEGPIFCVHEFRKRHASDTEVGADVRNFNGVRFHQFGCDGDPVFAGRGEQAFWSSFGCKPPPTNDRYFADIVL
jgi:hypothetical protein